MAEYTFNERWSAKLNISNLTDKLYADALYRGFYAPGAPRRFAQPRRAARKDAARAVHGGVDELVGLFLPPGE